MLSPGAASHKAKRGKEKAVRQYHVLSRARLVEAAVKILSDFSGV